MALSGEADITAANRFDTQETDLLASLQGEEIQRVGMGAGQILLGERYADKVLKMCY